VLFSGWALFVVRVLGGVVCTLCSVGVAVVALRLLVVLGLRLHDG